MTINEGNMHKIFNVLIAVVRFICEVLNWLYFEAQILWIINVAPSKPICCDDMVLAGLLGHEFCVLHRINFYKYRLREKHISRRKAYEIINELHQSLENALVAAIQCENDKCVSILVRNHKFLTYKKGLYFMSFAISRGVCNCLQVLTRYIKITKQDECRLIYTAIFNKQNEALKVLLKNGASPNSTLDASTTTALHLSTMMDNMEGCKILLQFNADINAMDQDFNKPIQVAIQFECYDCFHYLIEQGADLNILENTYQDSLLHLMALKDRPQDVKLLIDKGLNVNRQNTMGLTCLHLAALCGFHTTLKTLLEHAGDPNLRDNNGLTALDIAYICGEHVCIETLMNFGAQMSYFIFPNARRSIIEMKQNMTCKESLFVFLPAGFALNEGAGISPNRGRQGLSEVLKNNTNDVDTPFKNCGKNFKISAKQKKKQKSAQKREINANKKEEGAAKHASSEEHSLFRDNFEYLKRRQSLAYTSLQDFTRGEEPVKEKKMQSMNEREIDRECRVCMDNERNCVLLPCGHICVCIDCSHKLVNRRCPICKEEIADVKKVFL